MLTSHFSQLSTVCPLLSSVCLYVVELFFYSFHFTLFLPLFIKCAKWRKNSPLQHEAAACTEGWLGEKLPLFLVCLLLSLWRNKFATCNFCLARCTFRWAICIDLLNKATSRVVTNFTFSPFHSHTFSSDAIEHATHHSPLTTQHSTLHTPHSARNNWSI